MKTEETIDITSKIRELINHSTWLSNTYIENKNTWNKICSGLDVLGDTWNAIQSYKQIDESKHPSELYLLIYGLLQAVYMQQDTIQEMLKVLGLPTKKYEEERKGVRKVRNHLLHPVDADRGKSSIQLVMNSLTKEKCSYRVLEQKKVMRRMNFPMCLMSFLVQRKLIY